MNHTFNMALEEIRMGFEYELCQECRGDFDDHDVVEFLGNPLLMCKREETA